MTQIFVSYSRKDLTFIERLAADLTQYGCDVWYDLSGLDGGSRWIREIEKEISQCDYMLVVLSPDSIISENVEDEVAFAKRLKKKIIPLYYRPCEDRMLYASLNHIDVQEQKYSENFNKILRALNVSTVSRDVIPTPAATQEQGRITNPTYGDKLTLSNGMEFMRVPVGKFLMGSNNDSSDEKPQHTVDLPYDYWMGRYPVTNVQYNLFKKKDFDKGKENHPVVRVTWNEVMEYCQWLNKLLKAELPVEMVLRLPTEAEWEKAARGTDGREFPWGNGFDPKKCNTKEGGKESTTPVGVYSLQGDSPYGCVDMAGNVWEWCHSLYKLYPYKSDDGRENEKSSDYRILRGGSFLNLSGNVRCAIRHGSSPDNRDLNFGFRVLVVSHAS
jgi:formylglycine-generating enzyme required for sulfatase activity